MKEVLSKVEQRRLSLIEFMNGANERVPASLLTQEFDLSIRVLREDMEAINKRFKFLKIEEEDYNFSLCFDEQTDISEVYRQIFMEEKVFQLIEQMLFNPCTDDKVMAQRLGTSTSTLYRKIQAVNPTLKRIFEIEIRQNPYRFVGNEYYIRNFLIQYGNERFRIDDWVMKSMDRDFFDDFVNMAIKKIQKEATYPQYRYLKFSLLTNLLRIAHGYYIDDLRVKDEIQEIYERVLASDHRHLYEEFLGNYGLELNFRNFCEIFAQVTHVDFYRNLEEFTEKRAKDPEHDRTVGLIEEGLEELSTVLEVDFTDVDYLVYSIYQMANPFNPELDTYFIFRDTKQDFMRRLGQYFPHFYETAADTFLTYSKKIGIFKKNYDCLVHHFIYKLIVLQPQILRKLEGQMEPVRVLLLDASDSAFSNFMKDYLERNFNYLQVEVYQKMKIDCQAINEGQYDIIMSQILLPGVKGRVIPLAWKVLPPKQEAFIKAYKDVLDERARTARVSMSF